MNRIIPVRPAVTWLLCLFIISLIVSACGPNWSETDKSGFKIVTNKGGKTLGYSPSSGVTGLPEIYPGKLKD